MNELSSAASSHFTMCHIYRGTFTEDYVLKAACSPFTHVRTSSRLPNEAHAHIYFELQIDFFPLEYTVYVFHICFALQKNNIYCKSDEMHKNFLCILYYTTLALRVSGVICAHHQKHKLQSTAVGTRDCYGVLKLDSPMEQVAAGTPSHLQHGQSVDRAVKMRGTMKLN
jgi:hypothetical protein